MNLIHAFRPGWLRRGLLMGLLALTATTAAAPLINEFLAANNGGLKDEDGDTPDWIELYNPDATPVNLAGWALTDTVTNLAKWRLPATNLPAGGYLVVFASGKDRAIPGAPLHTSFKLDTAGEYLALVRPDGTNVASEFTPAYPAQFPNIAFGRATAAAATLLEPAAPTRVSVPADDSFGTAWRNVSFVDSGWVSGNGGVGYETSPADYAGLLGVDVGAAMTGKNGSCYARFRFPVAAPASLEQLQLVVQYDDGFVAWLNGREIARRSAPDQLAWDSLATADHPDGLAVVPEMIDVSTSGSALVAGENLLAVQILNVRVDSSDLLFRAGLVAQQRNASVTAAYFPQPTPGGPNLGGVTALGPLVDQVGHRPGAATATNDVVVTARLKRSFDPVAGATLFYRVMFGPEASLPLLDDGLHGDGAAGDGVFGTVIPAGTATAGQMLRYRVVATDAAAHEARLPLHFDPTDSEEYFGTVIADPALDSSRLPAVHLFVQNVGASEDWSGTRVSLEYLGEFYDNLGIRLHGQSSSGFPKKSFNLDFNRDHRFRHSTNGARVKDIKLMTNYGDKSRLHNSLAYEVIHAAGSVGHFAFPVRVQRNGAFHGVMDFLEDADDRYLERAGLNPDGALYKAYDSLDSPWGSEKKTRREEGNDDLQALIDGLAPAKPIAQRAAYAYDNVDLAQTVSYFVGLALVSSQDHGHKNFFVYRDSTGSGDWTLLPWDVDLTFGRNWLDSAGYFTDTLYPNNVLNFYNSAQQGKSPNRFYNVIFQNPDFRRMYLRRLRTTMDEVLQAPGTPPEQLRLEARIRERLDQLDPVDVAKSDADLDEAKWGTWGTKRTTRAEAQRILDLYLPGRRNWLFNSASAAVGGERIPATQPARVAVAIDQLDFNPAGGQAGEYLRLTNAEPFAVDVSGWKLRGEVRHTFRPGTVIPAGRTLHVARDVAGFRNRTTSPKRGENAFVQGNYAGQLSARGGTVELLNAGGNVVSVLGYGSEPTPAQQQLRLSELMFHPANPPAGLPFTDEDFEFLELKNFGAVHLDLAGARFTEGVLFAFTKGPASLLAPGARRLLVKNAAAFTARYGPGLPVAGEYLGNLANEGETLRLEDAAGEVVFEFRYAPDWFAATDGPGASLEPISPDADLELPAGWRASPASGGSPGRTAWPPVLESYRFADGLITVKCHAEAGVGCALETSPALAPANWQSQAEAPAAVTDVERELSAPAPEAVDSRFFRLSVR